MEMLNTKLFLEREKINAIESLLDAYTDTRRGILLLVYIVKFLNVHRTVTLKYWTG